MKNMENDLIRRSDVFNQSVRWEEINGIGFVTVAEDDIKAIPAVDAVEVVRCRECKYWFNKGDKKVLHSCELDALMRPEWWFCAGGQRREDGDGDG